MIKLFKFIMMLVIQLPITVFYYLNPANPIPFMVYQLGVTIILFLMDNAISVNYHNCKIIETNFEDLLEKILKTIPKNREEIDSELDDDVVGDK